MVNCKIQIYFLVFVLTLSLGNLSFARDSVNDIGVQINGKILKLNFDFNKYFYLESPKYHFSIIEKNDNQIKYELFLKNAGAPNYLTVHYYDDAWKSKLIYLPNSKNTENQKNVHNNVADILVEIDKKNIRYGEGVLVKYSLVSKQSYLNYRISKFPSYDGFVKRFLDPGNVTKPIRENGVVKYITPLYLVELFPLRGVKKNINDMEIIVNENSNAEFVLKSINPKFIYKVDDNFDPFTNLKVEIPEDLNLGDDHRGRVDFNVKVYGRGMLENLGAVKFSGEIIDSSKVTIVDQVYRPGFAQKVFKVSLKYKLNKSGRVDFIFGGKIRKTFQVDSFVGKNEPLRKTSFEKKLIFKTGSILRYFTYITWVLFVFFFLFPEWLSNRVRLFFYLVNMYRKNIFPISSYNSLVLNIFNFERYNLYFIQEFMVLRPVSAEMMHIMRKVQFLLNNYSKDTKKSVNISFLEMCKLILFLNKEGMWKF